MIQEPCQIDLAFQITGWKLQSRLAHHHQLRLTSYHLSTSLDKVTSLIPYVFEQTEHRLPYSVTAGWQKVSTRKNRRATNGAPAEITPHAAIRYSETALTHACPHISPTSHTNNNPNHSVPTRQTRSQVVRVTDRHPLLLHLGLRMFNMILSELAQRYCALPESPE